MVSGASNSKSIRGHHAGGSDSVASGYSAHQARYFAWWLTRRAQADIAISRTLAKASIDMNPHQVEAALFALHSPLSQGVLLADEVGLGKTIEAGLVLAQHHVAGRGRILLIVPATLRKQWAQELIEKFGLSSRIVDAQSYRQAGPDGQDGSPFASDAIVICSYEFAAKKAAEIGGLPWDLIVFDEAHKLRSLHRGESAKRAWALAQAFQNRRKLLLTATPFQNSLLELYGLVSFIDPNFFGSKEAFQIQYATARPSDEKLRELKHRLSPIAYRTLRRQVQEEGGIDFKRRFSITQDFTPSDEEWRLYEQVSAYLQDESILAIKPGARHLVTLVVRKILASSSFAITNTLEAMIRSLEVKQQVAEEALKDFENTEQLKEELDEDEDTAASATQGELLSFQAELEQLRSYHQLAASITRNAKSVALLQALNKAFEMAGRFGAERKAVIFTESVRTQSHLKDWLEANGYAGQIVLLNGSNADADSRALYAAWLARHQDSPTVSGSKTADMKAAIVEEFRERRQILISTEAGGEGVNLQFCSLLINYDLPWNPQRVEQRIGRVHRYGQKYDVVVVNFVNRKNRADQLVFELLARKFKLFDGVFGASDEILGAVESGISIERRILEVYQKCRDPADIEREFAQLQRKLDEEIQAREQKARDALLANLDEKVIPRLRFRRSQICEQRTDYERQLLRLIRALHPQARFMDDLIEIDGHRYAVNHEVAATQAATLVDPESGIGRGWCLQAREAPLADGLLRLSYAGRDHQGQLTDLQPLIGGGGRLAIGLLRVSSHSNHDLVEHLLVAAVDHSGRALERQAAERLLQLPGDWQARSGDPSSALVSALDEALQTQRNRVLEDSRKRAEQLFVEETDRLDRWAEDQRLLLRQGVDRLDEEIKLAKRQLRELATLEAKAEAKRRIKALELKRDETMKRYYDARSEIGKQEDELLIRIEAALKLRHDYKTLFAVDWQLDP